MSSWLVPSINISLGTPPQTLVASLDLVNGITRLTPGAFKTDSSGTFKSQGNFSIAESQNSPNEITVSTSTDELAVGGWRVNDAPLGEPLQNVHLLTIAFSAPDDSNATPYRATLGLGWHRPQSQASEPLWKAWKKPLFGLFLRRAVTRGSVWSASEPLTPDVGSISFGSIDEEHAEGEQQWVTADGI